jgi:hypothetical protein
MTTDMILGFAIGTLWTNLTIILWSVWKDRQ